MVDAYMERVRAVAVLLAVVVSASPVLPALATTDDPLFPQQWGLLRVGAQSAWSISQGEGVVIAVIDTGVHLQHADLKQRLVPGKSLVDDAPPEDTHGHGTLVSGIAAASANNKEGIAGVAPMASIMPVRVFDSLGSATSRRVAEAIRFAVDAAAGRRSKLVLNLSFVGPSQENPVAGSDSSPIFGDEAVKKAIADAAAAGAAVVLPAGNEGAARTAFDAPDHRGIIVVGASDKQDNCAGFTNYGEGLDILAPGVGILSTFWNPATQKSGYAYADGTSMSVPFVSGAAALLMSQGMTNVEAIDRIIATASGSGVSCRGEQTSYPILDVASAMKVERSTESPNPQPVDPSPIPSAVIRPAGTDEVSNEPDDSSGDVDPLLEVSPLKTVAFLVLVAVLILFAAMVPERKRID
ncbi:MAG: S8 family serine peptidase [Actinomycetota bacterium]